METWQLALGLVLALGVAVIAYGFITDRNTNRDLSRALHAPARRIPGQGGDSPAPDYLTGPAVRRDAPPALPADLIARLRAAIDDPLDSDRIDAGLAGADFVNDAETGWAVAIRPQILVCDHPITDFGELVSTLAGASAISRALVLVAPDYSADVVRMLAVNVITQTVGVVAVVADDRIRTTVCEQTGASQVSQAILRGDALRPQQLGEILAWVSDPDVSWLIHRAPATRSG